MNPEEKINMYKESVHTEPREEKIQETIRRSKDAFFMAEHDRVLSYHEFLWIQLKVIQKRWWVLQLFILAALWLFLTSVHGDIYVKKSMGVAASLFVILIIPELWKNRSCECMEIEAASYYSLKQVYAARMLMFGIMDAFLLTVFCGSAAGGLHIGISELVIQFLFPLSITACICFGILCSKYCYSESAAIILCIIWSAVWLYIVLNESVYTKIAIPVWFILLGFAFTFLFFSVYRILKSCNQYLEVPIDEIRT